MIKHHNKWESFIDKVKRLTNDTWVTHGPTTLVMSNDYSIVKVWGSISLSHTQVGVHPTSPKVDGFFDPLLVYASMPKVMNCLVPLMLHVSIHARLAGSKTGDIFWILRLTDTIHWDVLNIASIHFWDPKVTMWQGLSYPETSGTIRFGTRCNC